MEDQKFSLLRNKRVRKRTELQKLTPQPNLNSHSTKLGKCIDKTNVLYANSNNICKGRWLMSEHYRFLRAVMCHGTDWRKIKNYVKSRSTVQIRTHSQKYLIRLERCIENPKLKEKYRGKH